MNEDQIFPTRAYREAVKKITPHGQPIRYYTPPQDDPRFSFTVDGQVIPIPRELTTQKERKRLNQIRERDFVESLGDFKPKELESFDLNEGDVVNRELKVDLSNLHPDAAACLVMKIDKALVQAVAFSKAANHQS